MGDHLSVDGAGFAGGQVSEVDKHLELVHGFLSLRNIDLVVALHTKISPFAFFERKHFPKKAFSVPWG